MKTLVWFVSFFSALMLTIDTYAQDKPNPLKGKRLYHSYCLVCHGVDGKGNGPLAKKLDNAALKINELGTDTADTAEFCGIGLKPTDLSSDQYQMKKVEDLAAIIEGYGRKKDSNMLTWGEVLPKTELYDIAAYISKLTQEDLRFKGDSRRGRAIFKTACVACHGQFGKGNGILAQLIEVSMIDYTKSGNLEKISDKRLIKIIREGKGDYMPSWKGIFDENEITDVAAYVRRLSAMARTIDTNVQYEPNPITGGRLYRSYCLVCHGVDGKGIGPLAEWLDLKPADLSSEQDQMKKVEDLAEKKGGLKHADLW
jgi:mono/diheme cytochrome c family protein